MYYLICVSVKNILGFDVCYNYTVYSNLWKLERKMIEMI